MRPLLKTLIPLGIFFGSLAVGYIAFAWTAPSATPPGNNVAAPINVSNAAQSKTGNLYIGGSSSSAFPLRVVGSGTDTSSLWVDDATVLSGNTNVNATLSVGASGQSKQLCLNGDCRTAWPASASAQWSTTARGIYYAPGGNVGVGIGDAPQADPNSNTAYVYPLTVISGFNEPTIYSNNGYCKTYIGGYSSGLYSDCPVTAAGQSFPSSKALKENFQALNPSDIIQKIDTLPVMEWNYIAVKSPGNHIGPFAEDFYSAFGLSTDNKTINIADEAGVTLAGVKALSLENKDLKDRVTNLENQNSDLRKELDSLNARLDALELR